MTGEEPSCDPRSCPLVLVFVVIPLLLGWLHEGRFFGECLIVGIRFFKHEIHAWRDYLRRLKREVTTWKSDP